MRTEKIQELRNRLRSLGMSNSEILVIVARKMKLQSTYQISSFNHPYKK